MPTRVLLVDDHQMVREGLRAILEQDDAFSVVGEASSGQRGGAARASSSAPTSS